MMKTWVGVLGVLLLAGQGFGDVIYNGTFENQPFVGSGNPAGWAIFGTPLDDRGTIHNSEYHSATAAVWVAFTWQGWGWGATTVSNEGIRYNILDNNATVGAWLRATNAFSAASISFTIYDADGTQLRADGTNLFSLGASWAHYATPVGAMSVEAAGSVPGLDFTNITHFGFLAFTSGQTGQNQIQFDDFTVSTIPEPGTAAILLTGLGIVVLRWRSRRRA